MIPRRTVEVTELIYQPLLIFREHPIRYLSRTLTQNLQLVSDWRWWLPCKLGRT